MFYDSQKLLVSLEYHIDNNIPFSNIRLGDACGMILGMVFADKKLRKMIGMGINKYYTKWKEIVIEKRINMQRRHLKRFCVSLVEYCNEANFIDALLLDKEFTPPKSIEYVSTSDRSVFVQKIFSSWKDVYQLVGITNTQYISYISNYLCAIEGRENIVNIMKDRKVFFINGDSHQMKKKFSGLCKDIGYFDVYKNPGKQLKSNQYEHVLKLIEKEAKNYDLFLIGAGICGKAYCGHVKRSGGVAFDLGGVYNYWGGDSNLPPIIFDILTVSDEHQLYKLRRSKNYYKPPPMENKQVKPKNSIRRAIDKIKEDKKMKNKKVKQKNIKKSINRTSGIKI